MRRQRVADPCARGTRSYCGVRSPLLRFFATNAIRIRWEMLRACIFWITAAPMMFSRPRADAQLVRDKLGRQPLQQKGENLPLALCQQRLPGLESLHFERGIASFVAARQGFLDSQQQRLGVERLLDKMEGPSLHRQDGRRHIAIGRYHDDRGICGRSDDAPQKFDAAHTGKLVVEENASRVLQGIRGHVVFGRAIGSRTRSERSTATRSAHPAPRPRHRRCARNVHAALCSHPLIGNSTTNRAPPVVTGSHQRRPACL